MTKAKSELIGSVAAGGGESRLDVVLTERGGEAVVALQLSVWSEALGWQAQKTIPVAAEEIGQLQRVLAQTRGRIEERARPAGARALVIPFAPPARRPAAPARPGRAEGSEVKSATS